jgi:hypothetical protein
MLKIVFQILETYYVIFKELKLQLQEVLFIKVEWKS